MAREVVLALNPRAEKTLVAHHANVKDAQFGLDYFKQVRRPPTHPPTHLFIQVQCYERIDPLSHPSILPRWFLPPTSPQ